MANLLRKLAFTVALIRDGDSVVGQIEAESCTGLAQNQVCYTQNSMAGT